MIWLVLAGRSSKMTTMATPERLSVEPVRSRLHCEYDSSNDDEDFLLTQPLEKPLAGVIAFVDVRLGRNKTINSGETMAGRLTELGATISPRLSKDVTHIVFKDGKTNLDRIDRKSVFVVSPLWVESCKRCNEQVSEAKYPVVLKDAVSDNISGGGVATTPIVLGRIKRLKSMQPKPFAEDEVTRSVERNRKRQAGLEGRAAKRPPTIPVDPFEFQLSLSDTEQTEQAGGHGNPIDTETNNPHKKNTPKTQSRVVAKKKPKILCSRQQKVFVDNGTKEHAKSDNKTTKRPPLQAAIPSKSPPSSSSLATNKAIKRPIKGKENHPVESHSKDKENHPIQSKPLASSVKTEGSSTYSRKRNCRHSFEKNQPSIVITSLEHSDREAVFAVVDSLGGFEVTKIVEDTTTHVVCGATRRTVNVLAGTAKGCWLLSVDWIWSSLEAGKWLPEGAFEMASEFPAAQFFRLERHHAGLLYRPSLFHKCGSIYVSKDTSPAPQELEHLLHLSGAKLTGSKRKADVCVGSCKALGSDAAIVSEQWVIDSITEHAMLPLEEYVLDENGSFARAASPEL